MSKPAAQVPENAEAPTEIQVPTDFQGAFEPHSLRELTGPWDLLQSLGIAVLLVAGLLVLVSLLALTVAPT